MKITKDQLKGWNACRDGYEWFLRRFPEGEAEYQDVLNALAEDDLPDDADWLMDNAGPDLEAVLEVDVIADCKHFFAAGRLIIKTSATVWRRLRAGTGIEAGTGIDAGWGIKAGKGIKAGEGIEAGWGIEAGEGIKAGWGIEAGTDIEAGEDIEAGWGIKAGWGIEAGWGIKAGEDIEAGEGIKAGKGIKAGTGIKAGEDIDAGEGIKAGKGIEAGTGIEARWGIEAGKGFGIFAGFRVQLADWPIYAKVIAKAKPDNLISGFWVEPAAGSEKEAA